MAQIDDMPLDTNAYLADTGHLSTFEHGAYLLILMAMWRTPDGWISNDDQYLARASRMTNDKWRKISPTIRALLRVDGEKISQKRLLKNKSRNPSQDSSTPAKPLKIKGPESDSPPGGEATLTPSLFKDSGSSQEAKGVAPSKHRRAPRAMLPADWAPSEHGILYAKSKGFSDQRIAEMGRGCMLYYRKRGDLIADREMMWQGWVDREVKFDATRVKKSEGRPTMAQIARGDA